jgi:AcrR family transcriptional regulator
MKKTSEKILDAALELFNQYGLYVVTLRQIAGHLQISQGNLNYHFAKKEDIITAVYQQFAQEMEQRVQTRLQNDELDLEQLNAFLHSIIQLFLQYRFVFLDFARLMQEHPDIKAHYVQLVQQRVDQFSALLHVLAKKGILKPEAFPGQFRKLYKRIQVLTDFWISYHVIEGYGDDAAIQRSFLRMIQETLFPYLTASYQQQWLSYQESDCN